MCLRASHGLIQHWKQIVIVNRRASASQQALRGIPQGSVLRPILIVIYINTLPEAVKGNNVFLFADDTEVHKAIYTKEDCEDLQEDVDNTYNWACNFLLKFYPDKCGTMRIGS